MGSRVFPRLAAIAAIAASMLVYTPSRADGDSVVVGEVSTTVGHEEVMSVLKSTLTTELAKVKVPSGKKFVVSASLNKLDVKGSSVNCVVSLALRDGTGSLLGVLEGTASSASGDSSAKVHVVEAAVHGATKGMSAVVTNQ